MKFNSHLNGSITVNGIPGEFVLIKKINTFTHINHVIRKKTGYGCEKYEFVGSVCRGNYSSENFPARGNTDFGQQITEKIENYIQRQIK